MKHSTDKLAMSKANALVEVYGFCMQYGLAITISPSTLTISLPCGAEMSATFDPIGCEYEAGKLIYGQFVKVKELMQELKDKEIAVSCFDENTLRNDYLKGSV